MVMKVMRFLKYNIIKMKNFPSLFEKRKGEKFFQIYLGLGSENLQTVVTMWDKLLKIL